MAIEDESDQAKNKKALGTILLLCRNGPLI